MWRRKRARAIFHHFPADFKCFIANLLRGVKWGYIFFHRLRVLCSVGWANIAPGIHSVRDQCAKPPAVIAGEPHHYTTFTCFG